MSIDLIGTAELPPYDDEEEIQLMDTDGTNLQLDEPVIETNPTTNIKVTEEDNIEEQEERTIPSVLVVEKKKVYMRDGPNRHRVETITVDDKYYELPTSEQLASIELTEEKLKELLESLNLTKEDFRSVSSPDGTSRPESILVRGVNNMSTQEILNYFEEFKPIGIEWISDNSCNIFWYDTLTPLQLLATMTEPGPSITNRRSLNSDQSTRSLKRKFSSRRTSTDNENTSVDDDLPLGHWRQGSFQSIDKPDLTIKFYLRYTTLDDRKARGAENKSEYYRQHGNPNYNNMTGLISRSKKRALNAVRTDRFRGLTVVKSNNSAANNLVEEIPITTTEENTTDSKVKFTVVLPPKKDKSPEKEQDEEDDDEGGHRSKRQRRRRSWEDDDNDDRQQADKIHFTVTIDSKSKHTKDSRNKSDDTLKSTTNDTVDDDLTSITDARQILERKRRNRK